MSIENSVKFKDIILKQTPQSESFLFLKCLLEKNYY